jgi:hypothetical protein
MTPADQEAGRNLRAGQADAWAGEWFNMRETAYTD